MKIIVLCGSMSFKEELQNLALELEKMGYIVELPIECIEGKPKEIASKAHFSRIADPMTDAVLIYNLDKKNKENYIGPNSFAEVALAFYFNKKVFLYKDIYEPYKDELTGWKVIPLKEDLQKIKEII